MPIAGSIFVAPGSAARPLAEALAWLWRLGPLLHAPAPGCVGFFTADEAPDADARPGAPDLAGSIILAGGPGPGANALPERRRCRGRARFADGLRLSGDFTIFATDDGEVRSNLGVHATRAEGTLGLGFGPEDWATLQTAWALPVIARFLAEALERPLTLLPPLGCLRLDDFPGTAELQLRGEARGDLRQERRARELVEELGAAGARLVVAAPAQGLDGRRFVGLERVWPRALAALRGGIEAGVIEPACHGLLHLDRRAYEEGRLKPREFASLDRETAAADLDRALTWMRRELGEPRSFIAPGWGYSEGALAAAAERELPTWLAPHAGPMLDGLRIYESLEDGLWGLSGLDYSPLARLAEVGVPPIVVFHGWLLDGRLANLRQTRDLAAGIRLSRRRDLLRIPHVGGVQWVGASELMDSLAAHERRPPLAAGEISTVPAGTLIWDRAGRRALPAPADR